MKQAQQYLRDLVLELGGQTVTDDQGNAVAAVAGAGDSVAVTSSVNAATTSQPAAAANANRRGWVFVNDVAGTAGATAYVLFGAGASSTLYTYQVAAGATLEMPQTHPYTGAITVAWAAALGVGHVTEW